MSMWLDYKHSLNEGSIRSVTEVLNVCIKKHFGLNPNLEKIKQRLILYDGKVFPNVCKIFQVIVI